VCTKLSKITQTQ